MLNINGVHIPGEFKILEGINMFTFIIKKTEPWVKKHLTELSLCSTLLSFSYSDGDIVLHSDATRITCLSSKQFYVEFMEGELYDQ